MRALEKREAARERRRETRTVDTPDGPVSAVVWVSQTGNGTAPNFESLEARLRAAHGVVGNGSEYVRAMVHALQLHGIRDELVDTLWERLQD
jgi:cation transport regulator ChaC